MVERPSVLATTKRKRISDIEDKLKGRYKK